MLIKTGLCACGWTVWVSVNQDKDQTKCYYISGVLISLLEYLMAPTE